MNTLSVSKTLLYTDEWMKTIPYSHLRFCLWDGVTIIKSIHTGLLFLYTDWWNYSMCDYAQYINREQMTQLRRVIS